MNEIIMQEFDGVKVGNTLPIHLIEHAVKVSAPAGAKVSWEYPGYISIILESGEEIAFGESLESASGYSWNNYDITGTNTRADSFGELGEANLIASELWRQTADLINKEGK